ncbi:bifunctional GNAT family N-acetyltransferase/carbon-nitrogen hydrolase family protein [Jiella sonneratiae]|uniref:GNAT family N-acetyltransferase n=1 Tax=Jiella sonneratiae TaxID=2816856 RepID=A0ABS3IYJ7_9HYPH|nr:bifunctional GNAT family N-acetyltransferase/carbon-nitrogen hydrolase family protein [Jiella sonneratiae]MBO0902488.1 GNAT family N-acetyltransferase [Jiella sonneratiae]
MAEKRSTPKIEVRTATTKDVAAIIALSAKVFKDEAPYTRGMVMGQLSAFPEGQFVVVYEDEIVGYAATMVLPEAKVMKQHSWAEVTGGGYAAMHDRKGDWLYGIEVCVDPDRRRLRIGKRLYDARRRLCTDMDLKGIAFGGRLPGYRRNARKYASPEDYIEAVRKNELTDPVATFHLRSGFEPQFLLKNYYPQDVASGGHGVLMVWRNPYYDPEQARQPVNRSNPDVVRIVTVQMKARKIAAPQEFYDAVEYFIEVAAEYEADFVVFPELFTLMLLSCEAEELKPEAAIRRLTEHTPEFTERLTEMAIRRNINIIGGSHATKTEDGEIQNVGYAFLRDGSVHAREKIHPTPNERTYWHIQGGDPIDVVETDCGPVGIMICYDSEFPEIARRLCDQGARILFVPFNTDTRHGYLRVRYCCQARAIENQCYVVTSGMTGNLANVDNLDIEYAQSGIFTPCDFPFARDGIAAEASENVEMVAVADLNLSTLSWARYEGSVRNFRDRRLDLYRTRWSDGG